MRSGEALLTRDHAILFSVYHFKRFLDKQVFSCFYKLILSHTYLLSSYSNVSISDKTQVFCTDVEFGQILIIRVISYSASTSYIHVRRFLRDPKTLVVKPCWIYVEFMMNLSDGNLLNITDLKVFSKGQDFTPETWQRTQIFVLLIM